MSSMINIDKQVSYWRRGADEDIEAASALIEKRIYRNGLYFVHLAIEKSLKALVCRKTQDLAPRTHNLVRLAEIAGIELSGDRRRELEELSIFCLQARYPDEERPPISRVEADIHSSKGREICQWLMNQ